MILEESTLQTALKISFHGWNFLTEVFFVNWIYLLGKNWNHLDEHF